MIILPTLGRKFQNKQTTPKMITTATTVFRGLICIKQWSKCFTYINSVNLHNNSTIRYCDYLFSQVEKQVQRDWVALLKVTNVISGRAVIVCIGEFGFFLFLPGLERWEHGIVVQSLPDLRHENSSLYSLLSTTHHNSPIYIRKPPNNKNNR